MKKVIAFILILLPIFLMVVISIAGQILSEYVFIPAESVVVVDSEGELLSYSARIKVGKNATAEVFYKVYPELATNKNVSFSIQNTEIAEVDENGVITGKDYGLVPLTITTQSGSHTARIFVHVTDEAVTDVFVGYEKNGEFLSISEHTMNVGEEFLFKCDVQPKTALNKAVTWSSSDINVAYIENGRVYARKAGTTTITATSKDGGKTDSFVLTVTNDKPVLAPKTSDVVTISTNTVNLINHIVFDETKLSEDDISFRIFSGTAHASLEGSLLTISTNLKIIALRATATVDGVVYDIELFVMML